MTKFKSPRRSRKIVSRKSSKRLRKSVLKSSRKSRKSVRKSSKQLRKSSRKSRKIARKSLRKSKLYGGMNSIEMIKLPWYKSKINIENREKAREIIKEMPDGEDKQLMVWFYNSHDPYKIVFKDLKQYYRLKKIMELINPYTVEPKVLGSW